MTDTFTILVSVEDGTKAPEDYGVNRKVNVTIGGSVTDFADIEAATGRISEVANAQVARLLGRATPNSAGSAAPAASAGEPAKRTRRTKEQIAADEAAAAKAAEVLKAADPTSFDDETPETATPAADEWSDDEPAQDAKGNPVEAETAVDDWDDTPAVEEITDAELNNLVGKKNAELGDPKKIRALINEFNPDPTKVFQLRQITAAERPDFLAKLKELKKD